MSQKPSSKPIRQDYIAKVRYTNNLPPPPLNPKFIQYNTTEQVSSQKEAEYLISSVFRKENFTRLMENIDEELGMNLNLINNRGFLDNGDETVINNFVTKDSGNSNSNKSGLVTLHPSDRALLRDAGIGKISKSEPGVSFLRRTEYIADMHVAKVNDELEDSKKKKKNTAETHDPEAQLRAVEDTFDNAQESLTNFARLKHPKKKHLKAVAAWPLLPDTSAMDTKYIAVKFLGSASISRELQANKRKDKNYNEVLEKNALETAILKPITSDDGEWISFYEVRDANKAVELNSRLNSTERERPIVNMLDEDVEGQESYKFKHLKNYDMNFNRFTKPYEELSIKFIPEEVGSKKRKVAYYYPVSGRIDLKKHRSSTNSEINRFLKDSTVDVINFKLREPSTNEIKKMDAIRSEFDPMEYEGEEEEEDEEDDAQADDARAEDVRDVGEEFNEASKTDEAD
ncbi:DNA-directed RNA polymerase II regulator [Scheffersomyces stipitis CBS 6054]|uniref:DNA-directed RNA polymerase II regulator n=1 Tax=Scheffersomyces stipitis (strain ATCC 58785 / CBS 6054 / NBRC 10063 / NRRL Y-11545) TaxID=322104 RepID=A3LTQ7_PICST|nr:DNA-directed RNA polymerase II regulator [Scheffersomyces stipitis CBS 6054]ABN66455.2 DNA-directed RNA polymerase II regulator [Scheffersomyces stipitis CBS 6054]